MFYTERERSSSIRFYAWIFWFNKYKKMIPIQCFSTSEICPFTVTGFDSIDSIMIYSLFSLFKWSHSFKLFSHSFSINVDSSTIIVRQIFSLHCLQNRSTKLFNSTEYNLHSFAYSFDSICRYGIYLHYFTLYVFVEIVSVLES